MHETIVAQSVFETILAESKKTGARPIAAKISCGQLNPINKEILDFAFEAAAKNTVCEGIRLDVSIIPLKCTCEKCSKQFNFDLYADACPGCGCKDYRIGSDAPLLLEEIEFED